MSAVRKLQPILVKRYVRSRLYDTANQHYISVAQLQSWANESVAFTVIDVETGLDVTRVLLAKVSFQEDRHLVGHGAAAAP